MTPDMLDKLLPHWVMDFASIFMGLCFVATLLIKVLPTPQEITWKPYQVLFNTVQRFSLVRRNCGPTAGER